MDRDDDHPIIHHRDILVYDRPVYTGLLNEHGCRIFRLHEPAGFVRFGPRQNYIADTED